MSKIVVFGGSGMIGGRAIHEALRRGHEVTAAVRHPAKVTEEHPNLTVQQADVTDPAATQKIIAGADAVISAVSPRDPGTEPKRQVEANLDSLVTALRALGRDAPYLVVVGGAGSLLVGPGERLVDQPYFPEVYKSEALAHAAGLEKLLGVSDVAWTYVSPAGVVAPGERTGTFRLGEDHLLVDADGNSNISAEDYAIVLIDEAEKREHAGRRFTAAY
ncbi:NAD(P)H-binding protein [Actinocrinis puniceicyclus]|uniref:NAD(P)H-binding protein n=1 Tax=Actinocrinis puniceicyclus TaxID=977794 RepID=A0A8J7WLP7_9ACTN|nr:NAD(P)H-binding protein [Actinocrinis puniceicyclus]MBS2964678.1 NAD(P)H-binding protein [Actinocrinis puniceicyclus]